MTGRARLTARVAFRERADKRIFAAASTPGDLMPARSGSRVLRRRPGLPFASTLTENHGFHFTESSADCETRFCGVFSWTKPSIPPANFPGPHVLVAGSDRVRKLDR